MMARAEFWYIFGLAAIILLLLRGRATLHTNLRDPLSLSFVLCVFVSMAGTVSKQPFIANAIDFALGANAAWLVADMLWLAGMTAGTYWIDLLAHPEQNKRGVKNLYTKRLVALLLVSFWMVAAAVIHYPVWAGLERGTINTGGSAVILSARLAYLIFNIWLLAYVCQGFYRQRQQLLNRSIYIRMAIPHTAFTVAIAAPLAQAIGMLYTFAYPETLEAVWPLVWKFTSGVQLLSAVLILATFAAPIYRAVIWLDKLWLVYLLARIHHKIGKQRPDLIIRRHRGIDLIARRPDAQLAELVSEIELARRLIGESETEQELIVPAGSLMSYETRLKLFNDHKQFTRGLLNQPTTVIKLNGDDPHALARWLVEV